MIEVVNRKTYRGPGEYIGRPSHLGNPYIVGVNAGRENVVKLFRAYAKKRMKRNGPFKKEVQRLAYLYQERGRLVLICWCAPEACHGDVVAELIYKLSKQ